MPIQWLDVILILIMLISAFLAMLRGLTREMLSIMSWALAALAALFFYQLNPTGLTSPPGVDLRFHHIDRRIELGGPLAGGLGGLDLLAAQNRHAELRE